MLFRLPNLESTTQLDDLRFPCVFNSDEWMKAIPLTMSWIKEYLGGRKRLSRAAENAKFT